MVNSRLVNALVAAYNAHDSNAVEALYTAGATHEDVALADPKHGPKQIAAGLAHFFSLFPDAHWTMLGQIDGPSSSCAWYRLTGTLQADFGPIPALGQQLDLRGVMVLIHEGSQIASTSDYWDLQTFQGQMSATG